MPVALVVAVLAALGTAQLGVAMLQRQRAQTAADAAALAGVVDGREAAAAVAAANGAVLVDFQRSGDDVLVRVMVGEAAADALASSAP